MASVPDICSVRYQAIFTVGRDIILLSITPQWLLRVAVMVKCTFHVLNDLVVSNYMEWFL